MRFTGSVIKEQGITFGIILVNSHVLNNQSEVQDMQRFGTIAFGPMPIILMAQDARGIPTYLGRKDIVNFLTHISVSRIPWKEYSAV